jgi:hypothetical protein
MRVSSIVVCAGLAPLLIAASPLRLQPSSPWDVDYAENSCRLMRSFGEGKATIVLMFESDAPDNLDMLVVGNGLDSYGESVPAKFLPVQSKSFDGRPTLSTSGKPGALWSSVSLLPDSAIERLKERTRQQKLKPGVRPPPIDLAEQATERAERREFASDTTELEIEARSSRSVILETGSLGGAIQAFDKCSRDSLRDWGVDPDLGDKIARPPWSPNVGSWLTSDDYPQYMVNEGQESEVEVRLLVDATGKVTKCTSFSNFQAPQLNQIACDKITKRATFEPAELADGTKVPGYYVNHIVFEIAR